MKLSTYVLVVCVLFGGLSAALAQDTSLERLDTWGRNRGWEGVGLLTIENRSTCTGTLIQPDLVLTAAHCLYDIDNGRRINPRKVEFRAGWRDGKSIARRFGKASVLHPEYGADGVAELSSEQISHDIALLQLADPILSTHADSFRTDSAGRSGSQVSVVSYGRGRNDAPSRQRSCTVLDRSDGVITLSCDVVSGSSGSPVFAMRDGNMRIVSVVSALGKMGGKQVSFGVDIEHTFAEVMDEYRSGRGLFPTASTNARRIGVGAKRGKTGARFIKP